MRGGLRLTSTPNRRFSFATVTSMCSWPWPDSSSSLVCGSRLYLIDGSSSSSRCIDVLILSSSPRVFGSMAYDSTGSGNVMAGNVRRSLLSPSVSLVSVSLSFATAPRSPALSSGTFVCVLPCSSTRWPSRSCVSRVLLWSVESAFSVPGHDAEHRDAAGERIGDGLPDERLRRLLLVGRSRPHRPALSTPVNGRRRATAGS